ncbi:hypothetical protein BN59_00978 [Legionella massiliensis]|uniref:DUF4123 domain-containing protein n=1 Tax=Legionella massiliensis TaxID=1034943 RepID=A0A078KY48_9GAMM|nr:hypothetical protein [Legionella massiliensis]CDZ76704.1 hypothetical protein BN59_00978 [Legionella massiliensis]CEE12442.1 hypothetical protein BN1094_00978 [Legionella massiliensis]
MNLYLEPELSQHRHGRFFQSQLNALIFEELPHSGMVLIHGNQFQELEDNQKLNWWRWASQPACCLLLIPPFNPGKIYSSLDWRISFLETVVDLADINCFKTLYSQIVPEVATRIDGMDGETDRQLGYQWKNLTINTRYFKTHSGSGVFSATCLPLWSISLLNHTDEVTDWLLQLLRLAGKPGTQPHKISDEHQPSLEKTDFGLMVCIDALNLQNREEIIHLLKQNRMGIFSFSDQEIDTGFERLEQAGFLSSNGLSDKGINALQQSPYWIYTERLKEEWSNERS